MTSVAPNKIQAHRVSLDPEQMTISQKGIENFEFPISYRELIDFGQTLEFEFAALVRDYHNQKEILPYKLAAKNFICTVCGIFQSDLLLKRLDPKSKISVPDLWKVWPYTFSGAVPPEENYITALRNSQPQQNSSIINRIFRKMKRPKQFLSVLKKVNMSMGGMIIDGMKISKLSDIDMEKNIVATQRTDIIAKRALISEGDVYFCPSKNWFFPVVQSEIDQNKKALDSEILHEIFSIIESLYRKNDLALKPLQKNYLKETLCTFVSLIKIHLKRLSERSDIPYHIWTGTGGYLWDTILRNEVLRRGGKVTAHDHAGGIAHLNYPKTGFNEMWACDKFISYNNAQAHDIKQSLSHWPLLDNSKPEIEHIQLNPNSLQISKTDKFLGQNPDIKNVLLFSTLYNIDKGRGFPLFPYLTYIDWQARLISFLKEKGFNVFFKPHPESYISPPKAFHAKLGAEIVTGKFEELNIKPDMFIFDLTNTSVFKPCLYTNTPITIIDFGTIPWNPKAFQFMQKRCGYVRGNCDRPKLSIDWTELERQIELSSNISNNHEFAKTYYA